MSDERRNRIRAFLEQMALQDNRSTAFPYFYVIRSKVEDSAPLESCEKSKWYFNDESYDSSEDIATMLRDDGASEERIKEAMEEAVEFGIRYRWEHHGMFLTETDAELHLKQNYYHYSPDAHTYVKHAWRAPELTKFLKDLFEEFGINYEKW